MLVSITASVFKVSTVAGGSLANASSTGANTVNWPPLRVSTRFTLGFSCPDTADVSVVSSGLFDAATATGSWAIPATEPGPVGTFCAYAAQPGPTRPLIGSAAAGPAVSGLAAAINAAQPPPAIRREMMLVIVVNLPVLRLPPLLALSNVIRSRVRAGWDSAGSNFASMTD